MACLPLPHSLQQMLVTGAAFSWTMFWGDEHPADWKCETPRNHPMLETMIFSILKLLDVGAKSPTFSRTPPPYVDTMKPFKCLWVKLNLIDPLVLFTKNVSFRPRLQSSDGHGKSMNATSSGQRAPWLALTGWICRSASHEMLSSLLVGDVVVVVSQVPKCEVC